MVMRSVPFHGTAVAAATTGTGVSPGAVVGAVPLNSNGVGPVPVQAAARSHGAEDQITGHLVRRR
jgi:hypothetical protein